MRGTGSYLGGGGLYPAGSGTTFTGLLDTVPNARAAYSVRRLALSTTSIIRIRRSSDNLQDDFTYDSNNELSLDSPNQLGTTTLSDWIGADDGFVAIWYDQSGNGLDLAQFVASAQQQIVSSGTLITENGKPCLNFDKANFQYIAVTAGLSVGVYPNNYTLHSVSKSLSLAATETVYGAMNQIGDDGTRNFEYTTSISTAGRPEMSISDSPEFRTWAADNVQPMTAQNLLVQIYTGGTDIGAFFNGSTDLAKTTIANDGAADSSGGISQYFSIGRIGGFNANYFSGTFQEFVLYEEDKTLDLNKIESNVNSYFSIY